MRSLVQIKSVIKWQILSYGSKKGAWDDISRLYQSRNFMENTSHSALIVLSSCNLRPSIQQNRSLISTIHIHICEYYSEKLLLQRAYFIQVINKKKIEIGMFYLIRFQQFNPKKLTSVNHSPLSGWVCAHWWLQRGLGNLLSIKCNCPPAYEGFELRYRTASALGVNLCVQRQILLFKTHLARFWFHYSHLVLSLCVIPWILWHYAIWIRVSKPRSPTGRIFVLSGKG